MAEELDPERAEHAKRAFDTFVTDKRSKLARLVGDAPIAHRPFEFAGSGGRFGNARFAVRWVSAETRQRAVVDAVKYLTKKCGWDPSDLYTSLGEAVLDLESKVRMLAAGLCDPDDPTKTFVDGPDELRGLLDSDEIAALFEQLNDFIEERSPFKKVRTWEEVEGFVAALGKGWTKPNSLNSLDSASRNFMLLELARRQYSRMTPPSSDTSPPSDSNPSSTNEPANS